MWQLMPIIEQLEMMHPLWGLLWSALESFLPILPLTAIVAFNVYAHGFWLGYLVSFLGTIGGSTLLFLSIRKLFRARFSSKMGAHPKWVSMREKMQAKGFTPIFLLYCFPFTPSFFVSTAAAVAEVPTIKFLVALVSGKLVMIYILSTIGFHIQDLLANPGRSIIILVAIVVIWVLLEKVVKIDERIG